MIRGLKAVVSKDLTVGFREVHSLGLASAFVCLHRYIALLHI